MIPETPKSRRYAAAHAALTELRDRDPLGRGIALWWFAQLPRTGAVGEEYIAAWRDLNPAPPLSELVRQAEVTR